jgi:GR25 family glycosyltransferase involved in LPS biosynthesis
MSEVRKSKLFQMYCINLKERPDRWERFISQPGVQRLTAVYPFERFEGVNGKLLDVKNDSRVSLRTKRNILYQKRRDHEDLDTVGGVGCYLSHHGCWQKFLQGSSEYCLIFEDDADVPVNFLEALETAVEDINQEDIKRPEIWLLSRPWGPAMRKALELNDIQYTGNWAYDVTGPLTGYILSRNAAKILSDNAFPIDGHVDHFMHRCAQMGMLTISHNKNIILRQVSVLEKKRDSDIQQKPSCEVCDLPNAPRKKGYIILTNQTVGALTVGVLGIGALIAIRSFGRK